ncbi:nipblb [Symbiodinium sp. CCMP2456]|nr:nipblb [Symbiodinium sp. CCMP2456]
MSDRRDFEIEPAVGSQGPQLFCLSGHVSARGTRAHDLVDDSTPGTLVWYNRATGQLRTWIFLWQGWHPTLVQLMGEVEDDVLRLIMRKLTGEMISTVAMPFSTSWQEARNLMVPGLRQLLSKKLVFVSPLGQVLTPLQNQQPLSELLGCVNH